mmetsp:Transcript_11604/g.31074  ORF Transcript_11604/g.31074 Transcript_11604/m.31074 type:complete len:241 (-) Transcript_11604:157-879(-)
MARGSRKTLPIIILIALGSCLLLLGWNAATVAAYVPTWEVPTAASPTPVDCGMLKDLEERLFRFCRAMDLTQVEGVGKSLGRAVRWFSYFLFALVLGLLVATLVLLLIPETSLSELAAWTTGVDLKQKPRRAWMNAVLKLLAAVVLDALADVSYLLPFVGNVFDIIFWAPLTAWLTQKLFKSRSLTVVTYLKEVTFLDFIPTNTIAWVLMYWPLIVLGVRRTLRRCLCGKRHRLNGRPKR